MRLSTRQGIQVLRRVREFLAGAEVTAGTGPLKSHVEALGALVERLEGFVVEQDAAARGQRAGTLACRKAARTLRRVFMRPVSRMGKALFPNDETLLESLSMPKSRDYAGLIAGALAMAGHAETHKARFEGAGFAPDFVENLRASVATLQKTLDERSVWLGRRSAATAGTNGEYTRGRDLVRFLDSLVSPAWEDSPDRIAQWRTLSRFERPDATNGNGVVPATPPVAGTTPPTPTGSSPTGNGVSALPAVTPTTEAAGGPLSEAA